MKRALLEAQQQLELPKLVAPSSSETRWWSALPCLYFVKTQYNALRQIFTSPKHFSLLPTRNQMLLINRILKIIEPLKQLGESMSSEKNITISDLWPIYKKIETLFSPLCQNTNLIYCETEKNSNDEYSVPLFSNISNNDSNVLNDIFTQTTNQEESDNEFTEEESTEQNSLSQALTHVENLVASEILATLTKRYSSNQNTKILLEKTSFLDPRYRSKFLGDHKDTIERQIKFEMEQINLEVDSINTSKKNKKYSGIAAFLDSPNDGAKSYENNMNREVEGYLQMPDVSLDIDPTKWWQKYGTEFPKLAILAKKYLCIPGTSVPCERLFSTGGNICTDNRASLSLGHAEQLIFLSKNSEFII